METITLNEKVKVRTFTPPPTGFNPLTASVAELAKYGVPELPENAPQQELYKRLFNTTKGGLHYVEPTFQITPNKRPARAMSPIVKKSAGNDDHPEWSGGLVYAPTGMSFHWATGEWVVPNVSPPEGDGDYYAASWVGLDGDGITSFSVMQAGVECDVSRQNGKPTQPTIFPWWEWFSYSGDTGQVRISGLNVSAGDTVAVTIFTAGAGATEATLFFANVTQRIGMPAIVVPAPAGVSLVGNCAEWVVERPALGFEDGEPIVSVLADYGQVFFAGCNAMAYAPNGSSELVSGAEVSINMVNTDTTIASSGVLVAPTVVECIYYGNQ
jgi:Peptidase A4 family